MKIDVKEVVRSKSPTLARFGPLIRYLRRIIHEKQVNRILADHGHLTGAEFIRAALHDMGITYNAVGMDGLDPNGRYIFASNHPFGGLDGVMLAERVSAYFGDVRVVVNDLLMNVAPLAPIFIPINKHGRQSSEYSKLYNETFAGDTPIITFPAGLCSRRKKGVVCDLDWKHSFIKQAVANKRDVVPVYFDGTLSNFFYRLANLRTRLGIKANIEMLYLVDEMFKQCGQHFEIVIGRPIPWQSLEGGSPRTKAAEVKEAAYSLKKRE